jgi:hypothetical protein
MGVLGPFDYALATIIFCAEVCGVTCALRTGLLRRYFTLVLYLAASFLVGIARFVFLFRYGFTSPQYFYLYYYSDAVLTICLYFVLMTLFSLLFEEMGLQRYLRVGALLLLGGTAWFSYQVVAGASDKMITRFVVELSQNLYFVGLVLTYVLWGALVKLRETRIQLIQLILALGVHFSAFAANYALWNLFHSLNYVQRFLLPFMAIFLPAAWAYTFWGIPQEARIATARVASAHR